MGSPSRRFCLSFLLVFSTCLSAIGQQEKKTKEEYWANTEITAVFNAKFKTYFFADGKGDCYKSAINFKACISALDVLAREAKLALAPKNFVSDPLFELGALSADMGEVGLYAVVEKSPKTDKKTQKQKWEERQEKQRRSDEVYEKIYAQQAMNFQKLASHILNILVTTNKNKLPVAFANAYNTFMGVAEDAHAHIDPIQEFKDQNITADNSLSGIGLIFNYKDQEMLALEIVEGGPAAKIGLLPGDIVLSIDDVLVKDIDDSDEIRKRIIGPQGTQVKLKIRRGDTESVLLITRQKVVVDGVRANITEDLGVKIGYIQFKQFMGNDLCQKIEGKIKNFESAGVKGLVLDLRENPGGRLDLADCVSGLFIGKKVYVQVKDLDSGHMTPYISKKDKVTDLPLVVLINSGSASASEIVSGAVRDHERGLVVGQDSFGKGSVQSGGFILTEFGPMEYSPLSLPLDLSRGTIMLFKTIQRFYQPGGTTNQLVGIGADISVPRKPGMTEDEMFTLREQQLYPNALAADGEKWKPSAERVTKVNKVKECLDKGQLAAKKYVANKMNETLGIYQLLVAQEVLKCQIQP